MRSRSDFLVIGAGIAGASAAYHLAPHGRVTVLEMEPVVGYHSTGRSAALYSEYYGPPVVRALTVASRPFLADPPPGFTDHPLLTPRGVLTLCPAAPAMLVEDEATGTEAVDNIEAVDDTETVSDAEAAFEEALAQGLTAPVPVREIDPGDVGAHCPVVRPGWCRRAMVKPGAQDIDVDALHQGFLHAVRAAGGQVIRSARVRRLGRVGGLWRADTDGGEFTAPTVVNAAGAWADEVAALAGVSPVGLVPLRRTAFLVDAPADHDVRDWPMVTDVRDTFYFKPESGRLLVSPCDATPVAPGDARPDDLDVALGAARVAAATTLTVRHVRRAWAGLRTSTADDLPVLGAAPQAPGFWWLAGLGGYGVQTAPAAGRLLADLATGSGDATTGPGPGIDLTQLTPARFADRRPNTAPNADTPAEATAQTSMTQ